MSNINGVDLAWSKEGSGPLAVSAHILTGRRRQLQEAGAVDWSPVSDVRTLMRYDARGHGASTGTAEVETYQWPNLARDLLALIDEQSPAAPVAGLGLSMGTATLLHAATQRPDRFERLVLGAPPTAWETRADQAKVYRGGANLVEREGVEKFTTVVQRGPSPSPFANLPVYPPAPEVAQDLLPSVLRGAADSDLPSREAIAKLPMPVMVLSWVDDSSHPLSTGEELADLIPNASFNVAHSLDEVRLWGQLAAKFLRP